jgi:hypothetical protein
MTVPAKPTPVVGGLVKDVLGPSAKLVGSELRSYLKERFDEARERRRNENLNSHISAVRTSLPKPPPENVTYERLDLFSDWVEGAQDISEDDPLLSDMWREVLRDIVGGQHITKSLIEVMKQVDSRMAALLLSLARKRPCLACRISSRISSLLGLSVGRRLRGEDIFHAKRLEALGLLERDYTLLTVSILTVVSSLFAGSYFAYEYTKGGSFLAPLGPKVWLSVLVYGTCCGGLFIFWSRHRMFRLTWTASQLLKYAKPPKPESVAPESDAMNGTTKEKPRSRGPKSPTTGESK